LRRADDLTNKLAGTVATHGANTQHHENDELEWFLANMRRSFSYIDFEEPPLEAR
jgi:hypothetical protein